MAPVNQRLRRQYLDMICILEQSQNGNESLYSALSKKSKSENRNVTVWLHGQKHHKNCEIRRLAHSGHCDGAFLSLYKWM